MNGQRRSVSGIPVHQVAGACRLYDRIRAAGDEVIEYLDVALLCGAVQDSYGAVEIFDKFVD